jgi:hypothetical protein
LRGNWLMANGISSMGTSMLNIEPRPGHERTDTG